MNRKPTIVAHRGLHDVAPENSLAAFTAALAVGFRVLECDVHASRDGTPFILHDETLDRTTRASGPIAQWSDTALRALPLPTLAEAVAMCGPDVHWFVEIKPPDVEALVRAVIDIFKHRRQQLTVQSFDERNLLHAMAIDALLPIAMLIEEEALLDLAIEKRWPAIHLEHRVLTPQRAEAMHQSGTRVGVWTVNKPNDIERVLSLGVDTIITDEPARVQEMVEHRLA
jgi:glycerophosphoryl diester phosphodiesterase